MGRSRSLHLFHFLQSLNFTLPSLFILVRFPITWLKQRDMHVKETVDGCSPCKDHKPDTSNVLSFFSSSATRWPRILARDTTSMKSVRLYCINGSTSSIPEPGGTRVRSLREKGALLFPFPSASYIRNLFITETCISQASEYCLSRTLIDWLGSEYSVIINSKNSLLTSPPWSFTKRNFQVHFLMVLQ